MIPDKIKLIHFSRKGCGYCKYTLEIIEDIFEPGTYINIDAPELLKTDPQSPYLDVFDTLTNRRYPSYFSRNPETNEFEYAGLGYSKVSSRTKFEKIKEKVG